MVSYKNVTFCFRKFLKVCIFAERTTISMHDSLKISYTLVLLLASFWSLGQENLILNGDFEEYWQCPDDATQIERCKYVYNPCASVPSTSDYFNACYVSGSGGAPVGVPNTSGGYQNSRSGKGMVGYVCMDSPGFQYREYIQLSFSEPLECGKKYLIEGYFNMSDLFRYTIKNIGFLFSEDKINSNDFLFKNYHPQYTDDSTLINDTVEWIKISFEYIADAPHEFLTIGNFLKDSTESYVEINPNAVAQSYSTYVFLDDFSVKEIEGESNSQLPNVFSPNNDGINDDFRLLDTKWQFLEEINIVNRWGNEVISLKPPFIWDGLDSNGNKVTNGIYYCIIQTESDCKMKQDQVRIIHVMY